MVGISLEFINFLFIFQDVSDLINQAGTGGAGTWMEFDPVTGEGKLI